MIRQEPLTLDYKLSPIYSKKINQLAVDSKVSFQNFQTPGWSSIMHTETSPDPSLTKGQLNHNKILQKLNKLKDVDLSESNFSKVRVPDSTKSNNILIFEQHQHLIRNEGKSYSNKENYTQRHSLEGQPKNNRLSESIHNHKRMATGNSLKNSATSQKNNKSLATLRQQPQSHNHSTQTTKRFNQITVHQHLYLAGIKQSNKRMMQRILDEQYKKQRIMPFQPLINTKSHQLAEIKFSRLKEKSEIEQQLEEEMKKSEIIIDKKEKEAIRQEKQQNKYKILNRLFYFLSKQGQIISKNTIKQVIQELPLMCIRTLEKILEKVYAGKTLTWLQFLSEMNNKKAVANKQGLINVFQKWQSRLDKKIKESSAKQSEKHN